MSLFDRFKSLGRAVQEATQTIHGNIGELRQAISAKRSERDQAREGTLPPAEVIARFGAWVDDFAAYQAKERGAGLVRRFGAPPGRTTVGESWGPDAVVTWGHLCLFAGATLKEQFAALVRATAYTPGPPAAERAAVVARLDAELAELEAQEERLVDEAAAAGVVIAHRPDVVERRAEEAERARRTAQADADRRVREAAVNTVHERRVVHSEYLRTPRERF